MVDNEFAPVTPGEMLKEEFLAEYELSQNQLAKAVGISPNRITEIVNNRRRITADTALRFGLYFGNSPEFWLNLQTHYDLKLARRKLKPQLAKRINAQRAASAPPRLNPAREVAGRFWPVAGRDRAQSMVVSERVTPELASRLETAGASSSSTRTVAGPVCAFESRQSSRSAKNWP